MRLAEDIRSDIFEIDEINRVSAQRMSAMNFLLQYATGKDLPTGFDSARGIIKVVDVTPYAENDTKTIGIAMFILTTLDGNRLVYDTMVNNDGIGVIRDESLVRGIQSYYASVDQVLIFERSKADDPTPLVAITERTKLDGHRYRIRIAGSRCFPGYTGCQLE